MGEEGTGTFLEHHGVGPQQSLRQAS